MQLMLNHSVYIILLNRYVLNQKGNDQFQSLQLNKCKNLFDALLTAWMTSICLTLWPSVTSEVEFQGSTGTVSSLKKKS